MDQQGSEFWQQEADILRQQLQHLHESHRQLMGQNLAGLSIEELAYLENQLEISLRGVRMKKEQILTNEIQELKHKGNLIHQKNIELCNKVNPMCQEKMDLYKELYRANNINGTSRNSFMPIDLSASLAAEELINLQFGQHERQSNQALGMATPLGSEVDTWSSENVADYNCTKDYGGV
ncbi:hypothetical protein Cgig2_020342 [Carnegiea gigantea]|uniref:K-box domain-containing protein n=1 Tax=Carnegiea gigantea TaxID=171969 RepID=A0A9Q1KDU9_9CARY|nr:hypothetical protein Cgig2_020342 [Carnegiea gigantea]